MESMKTDPQLPLVAIGALSALVAVAAGAFAAHGLKNAISPDLLAVFQTGAQYQLAHALGIVLAGVLVLVRPRPGFAAAGWLFLAGTILFSGSLYVLALTGQRWLGAVTPFGGLAFLAGWAAMAWGALRRPIGEATDRDRGEGREPA